ncbi:MAG: hypothetical protein H6707_19835 [Deltaproteobacteria bacterium]|nr:hypothetical protein [Deltaproteobacteria bacterium]
MSKKTRWMGFLAAMTLLGSGCLIVDDEALDLIDGTRGMADLRVDWTIDGSQSSLLCGDYGVSYFRVVVDGYDRRESVVSCRGDQWSTLGEMYYLVEGVYDITVIAYDIDDSRLASASTSLRLRSGRALEHVVVDFSGASLY